MVSQNIRKKELNVKELQILAVTIQLSGMKWLVAGPVRVPGKTVLAAHSCRGSERTTRDDCQPSVKKVVSGYYALDRGPLFNLHRKTSPWTARDKIIAKDGKNEG
jgi:hypothetical protein